ncbi:TrbL/VirB6 family protein [Rickettsia canadensis]|uniref:TrbL/VirB6 plasmid conjugative transfer protein n=1 Tax=Rickettsia canadensis str. CA410 TaxID=1105107 RepID=A0ABN4AGF9_RICCA|nr:type IV secretion system protein [Rickettsia canadensis]AFB20678.1 TrbL/VirB6 plasmid conjugative transfer protein [Rickettsia canadensis str. CA410]
MKTLKTLKIFIMVCIASVSLASFAGFGESCSSLPATSDKYLETDTAYGYIIRNIDMKDPRGNCDSAVPGITFCFKNIEGSSSPCTMYTLNEGDSKKISDLSTDNNPDLGANPVLQNIVLTVKKLDNDLCLIMPTSRGPMPVACKSLSANPPPNPPDYENCNIGKNCYTGASYSQSLINFSGLAVQCLSETLNKIFFVGNSCSSQDQNSRITNLTAFSTFQGYLKRTIGAALILYIMFFAFNMALNKEYASTEKIALFIIKFLFVAYFSIGLGPLDFSSGQPTKENGMLKYGLPLLTGAAPDFAQMIFNAAGARGLCQFDNSKYKDGYKFYGLWDAIDCRIGYYLGLDLLYNIDKNRVLGRSVGNGPSGNNEKIPNLGNPDKNSPNDLSKAGSLRFFTVMFGFFMAGNVIIFAAGLVFSVIFLSILLYFITHYLVCMITIYVMTYVSPIFIPMALFTRTKAYFDGWLKVCISCTLQPSVIAGFIALLITMYDSAIFKNCEFLRHDYEKGDIRFSTFELRLPISAADKCQESFGYKMLQYYAGEGWEEHLLILFPIKSIVRDVVSILAELLYVLVFSVIFYYFSKSIGRFAADLTNGPNMDAVNARSTKIVDLVKKGAAFLKDAAIASQGKPLVGNKLSGGSRRKGRAQSDDTLGSHGRSSDNAKDALSTSRGK